MTIFDFLFPKFCLGCGLPGRLICPRCEKQLLPYLDERCFYCNKKSQNNTTHINCSKKFFIDQVDSFFCYNSFFKKIIKNFKYRLVKEAINELFNLINPKLLKKLDYYKNLKGKVYFQSIPLTKIKLNQRGFNQSQIIISFLQKFLPYPQGNFLLKVKETFPQAEISDPKKRKKNLKKAYQINQKYLSLLKEAKVILVDDVVTTGTTLKEGAKILKKYGANKVYALTLAR